MKPKWGYTGHHQALHMGSTALRLEALSPGQSQALDRDQGESGPPDKASLLAEAGLARPEPGTGPLLKLGQCTSRL